MFVPGSVAVVPALRRLVTGVRAEEVAPAAAKKRVPQHERDIAALNGQEFGRNSVGACTEDDPAA